MNRKRFPDIRITLAPQTHARLLLVLLFYRFYLADLLGLRNMRQMNHGRIRVIVSTRARARSPYRMSKTLLQQPDVFLGGTHSAERKWATCPEFTEREAELIREWLRCDVNI